MKREVWEVSAAALDILNRLGSICGWKAAGMALLCTAPAMSVPHSPVCLPPCPSPPSSNTGGVQIKSTAAAGSTGGFKFAAQRMDVAPATFPACTTLSSICEWGRGAGRGEGGSSGRGQVGKGFWASVGAADGMAAGWCMGCV
jgi:hypothetical protein